MARYWVGGTDNWDVTAGTKWSLTSGGAGGASVPTSADDVFIDANSGTNTVTITATSVCKSLDGTGATATLAGSSNLTIFGGITTGTLTISYTGTITTAVTGTINTSGVTWTNWTFAGGTMTVSSTLTISGNLAVTATTTTNGSNIEVAGNISVSAGVTFPGTSKLVYNGTGTWSAGAGGYILKNFDINTAGTLNFSGNVYYGTGTFKYVAGTVNTGTSVFINSSTYPCTLDTNGSSSTSATTTSSTGINFYDIICGTITLSSNLCLVYRLQYSTGTNFTGGQNIYINGSLNLTASNTGTPNATIILQGTGTWSGNFVVKENLTINTTGTITISGSVAYNTGTLTYTAGTVVTTGSTLNIAASTTLNTSGMNWNNITLPSNTMTITINSLLTIDGTFTFSNVKTFAGTAGFTADNLAYTNTLAGASVSYKSTNTYTVTTSFIANNSNTCTFVASTASSDAFLILSSGCLQKLFRIKATDINSTGGEPVKSVGVRPQDLLRTNNWTNNSGQFFNFF